MEQLRVSDGRLIFLLWVVAYLAGLFMGFPYYLSHSQAGQCYLGLLRQLEVFASCWAGQVGLGLFG